MDNHTKLALEQHQRMLNQDPPKEEVQKNDQAGGSLYLPISFVQTKLDEIFYGLWETRINHVQVIANEIIGHGELTVTHPVTGQKMTRAGAGAVMIQLVKGSEVLDASAKIKNTLVKDYPHLYAEITKSAAKTLGKIFGRDLNRKFVDQYNPYSIEGESADEIRKLLKEKLETNTLPSALHTFVSANVDTATFNQLCIMKGKVDAEEQKQLS